MPTSQRSGGQLPKTHSYETLDGLRLYLCRQCMAYLNRWVTVVPLADFGHLWLSLAQLPTPAAPLSNLYFYVGSNLRWLGIQPELLAKHSTGLVRAPSEQMPLEAATADTDRSNNPSNMRNDALTSSRSTRLVLMIASRRNSRDA